MIKSVVREYHWSPAVVGDLYFDRQDFLGLEYWFDDVKELQDQIKNTPKNTS
jgi:hypothetical protein